MKIKRILKPLSMSFMLFLTAGCVVPSQGDPVKIPVITASTQVPDLPQIQLPGLELKVFAGSGKKGNQDGPALQAEFDTPVDIVKDEQGNLYVAENGTPESRKAIRYNRIRKINPDGLVSTFAGGPQGLSKAGSLLETRFEGPGSLEFVAPDSLFVMDLHVIFRISLHRKTSEIFADIGQIGHIPDHPQDLPIGLGTYPLSAVYHQSQWYVGLAHKIMLIESRESGYKVFPFVGVDGSTNGSDIDDPARYYRDGSAQEAIFNVPGGLVFDQQNNLFVADTQNHRIRKVDAQTHEVTTYTGSATSGKNDPKALPGGLIGGFKDGSLRDALFQYPADLAITQESDLLVLDAGNHAIRLIRNGVVSTLVKNIETSGMSLYRTTLYLCDTKYNRIYTLDITRLAALQDARQKGL